MRSAEHYSQFATEAAEVRERISEEYLEAASNRAENVQALEAAVLKACSVVHHHHEHEEFAQTRRHHRAEQACFNLQRSFSAYEAEH